VRVLSYTFTLQVPSDRRFESLGAEVASRFVEIVGGTHADGTALGGAVTGAMHGIDANPGSDFEFSFEAGPNEIAVTVRHGSTSSTVTRPLPARKS
jgi:hypothetical protein